MTSKIKWLFQEFRNAQKNFGRGDLKNDAKVIVPISILIGFAIEGFMEMTGFYNIRRRKEYERKLEKEILVLDAKFHLVPEIIMDIANRTPGLEKKESI